MFSQRGPLNALLVHRAPPAGIESIDLTGDFRTVPYGLLSLAAEARAAGHQVKVLNVAGPRASRDPALYPRAREYLEQLLAAPRGQ